MYYYKIVEEGETIGVASATEEIGVEDPCYVPVSADEFAATAAESG